MTNPIPSAGETTIIGLPAINVLPVTTTGDRPLTQEDLDTITGSLNGTYVNRQRVDQASLKNGDEIMIGKFRLVFFTKSAIISQ